jgi:hypothetical protein
MIGPHKTGSRLPKPGLLPEEKEKKAGRRPGSGLWKNRRGRSGRLSTEKTVCTIVFGERSSTMIGVCEAL